MLQSLDTRWREHLAALDHLRQGIHLRGYAAKNPKQEYKKEAFQLFSLLLEMIRDEVSQVLMKVNIKSAAEVEAVAEDRTEFKQINYKHDEHKGLSGNSNEDGGQNKQEEKIQPFVRGKDKVGRNEPCPCGSGKKYKHCHARAS